MGKAFFTGWVLWQQMTFVLACGIVATVLIGLAKLRYDTLKIRKYTKVEAKGKEARDTPAMLEAGPRPRKEEIPFGIRAIESGIEIDGVWISRTNTPVGSSRNSIAGDYLRSQNNSQLELPQAIQASSRASSRAASSFDIAVNAERIPTNDSRSSSPAGQMNYNGYPYAVDPHNTTSNSVALQALEGRSVISASPSVQRYPVGAQKTSPSSSGKNSRRTSDESDYMAMADGRAYQAAYMNPRHPSMLNSIDPRTDLDLLRTHRMSHVAETGQLTPRVRRPGMSGEWASVADKNKAPPEVTTNRQGVDYFVPQQKTPSPPLPPMAAPASPPQERSSSKPIRDGHAANEAKQAVPLLETYASRPFYLPETYQPRGPHHEFSYEEMPIEVNTVQNGQRESQVIRKVNSGFEILRPGTFAPPNFEEEEKAALATKRQSRRLQKRRTNSGGSRTSHFVEQV